MVYIDYTVAGKAYKAVSDQPVVSLYEEEMRSASEPSRYRIHKVIVFLCSLFLLMAYTNLTFAQADQCQQLKSLERDLLNNLPIPVDDVTTLVGMNVNCESREIQFVKHLSIPIDDLEAGIADRKQQQYIDLHCNARGFATKGWISRDYIYDQALVLVMSLTAAPAMCR